MNYWLLSWIIITMSGTVIATAGATIQKDWGSFVTSIIAILLSYYLLYMGGAFITLFQ